MSLVVERPGLLSTVQDLGRFGHQHIGVPVNGVMDDVSHRMANWLVGNEGDEATLEITISGPMLRAETDVVIAVCGADMGGRADGMRLPQWRPVRVHSGARIDFGRAAVGARAYLSVAAGFDLPAVMGSRSTAVRGNYGGLRGRALRKGDALPLRSAEEAHTARWVRLLARAQPGISYPNWSVTRVNAPSVEPVQIIRVVPGRHWQSFPVAVREQFASAEYRVSPDSDRMGFRLDGPPIEARKSGGVASEAVPMGAIQVPHGGQPIVLMADRQTTGGYPVIAVVASADLTLMAQLSPRDRLRFEPITHAESYKLLFARERQLNKIHEALIARLQ